jgi:hypothetical protein
MTEAYYYMGRERMKELMREAEIEREIQQALREQGRPNQNNVPLIKRIVGNGNNRVAKN